jgi:uncharacterized membrane protein YfcA
LPAGEFKLLVGAVLLFSAWRFFWHPRELDEVTSPPLVLAVVLGAVIGLLSGLTGTGGGIFLTPLLLVAGWAHAKPAAAVSALFILANSAAGLLGNWQATGHLPGFTPIVAAMAAVGGLAGSYLGSRRLPATAIKRLLAAVLLIAGIKLLSGA